MKLKQKGKEILCAMIAATMILGTVPLAAFADGEVTQQPEESPEEMEEVEVLDEIEENTADNNGEVVVGETDEDESTEEKDIVADIPSVETIYEIVEMPELVTSGMGYGVFTLDNPYLQEGEYANWVDRLILPDEVRGLYDWMVENSDGDGVDDALIDQDQKVYDVVLQKNYTFTATNSQNMQAEFDDFVSEKDKEMLEESTMYQEHIWHAIAAFDRDYPEIFWTGTPQILIYSPQQNWSQDGLVCDISISINHRVNLVDQEYKTQNGSELVKGIFRADYNTPENIRQAIIDRDSAIENILSGSFPSAGSRYEKVKYLNNWLTHNNGYNTNLKEAEAQKKDHDKWGPWLSITALEGHAGSEGPVCEGYARALKVLCDELEIPCTLVDGQANSGSGAGAHMWNYVQMEDGKWYAIDSTWNDPFINNETINGRPTSGYESEKWLLLGSQTMVNNNTMTFIESHPASNVPLTNGFGFTNGPTLAEQKYDPETATPTGATISGTVNVAMPANASEIEVRVQLLDADNESSQKFGTMASYKEAYEKGQIYTYEMKGVTPGNYILKIVPTVEGKFLPYTKEITVTNNVALGEVTVVKKGDINADGKIDLNDVDLLFRTFTSYSGRSSYECQIANIQNNNETIDMNDVDLLFRTFDSMNQ